MNKQAVFSHFSKILDDMIENSSFFSYYFQQPHSLDDIYGSYADVALSENLAIKFGATRGCIVDDEYDYVVKFDIDEDGITGSACEREESIYMRAKEEGFAPYFAEVEYIGSFTKTYMFYDAWRIEQKISYCDYYDFEDDFMQHEDDYGELRPVTVSIPLYAYRRAQPHWCNNPRYEDNEEYKTMARKINSPMRDRNLAVAIDFVREYGEEVYQALSTFMYEENINDLHGGNVGDIDGHLCFIDYSGYHGSFSIDE